MPKRKATSMNGHHWKQQLLPACLALSGFFLPVWIRGTTLFLLIGILLFPFLYKQLRNPFRNEYRWFTVAAIGLFLWQCIGMFYTEDRDNGWFNLQQKLPVILFALYAAAQPALSKNGKSAIKIAFILGCLTCGIYLFIKAFLAYQKGHDPIVFSYVHFSPELHPSYLAMYLSIAMVFGFELLLQSKNFLQRLLSALALIVCYGCVVLLQSKAGLLAALLVIAYGLFLLLRQKQWVRMLAIIVGAIALNSAFLQLEKGRIPSRLDQAVSALREDQQPASSLTPSNSASSTTNATPVDAASAVTDSLQKMKFKESSQLRVEVWKSSFAVIQQNWLLGTGAGDARQALVEEYNRQGLYIAAEKRLNAHNQYLQQCIAGGVLSLWLLIVWLYSAANRMPVWRNVSLLIIPAVIAFNLLTESMLESQWGVLSIAYFLSINRLLYSESDLPESPKKPIL
ncbi:MAG: hypothetical protein RLZZ543_791 [Bacteroidota bacterium]